MKRLFWQGYPQQEGANVDADRPWWVQHIQHKTSATTRGWEPVPVKGWLHPSGAFVFGADAEEAMAQYDEEHPLPPPPPKCQQVWVEGNSEKSITRVERVDGREGEAKRVYVWAGTERYAGDWPPEGYVLAYGPLSPWAPTGKE